MPITKDVLYHVDLGNGYKQGFNAPLGLTKAQIEAIVGMDITDTTYDAIEARRANAINEAALATQLKSVTAEQAEAYVVQQITGGVAEATALAAFDAAGSLAAIKPVIRPLMVGMYRITDVLKLIIRLVIALRDAVMSELAG